MRISRRGANGQWYEWGQQTLCQHRTKPVVPRARAEARGLQL